MRVVKPLLCESAEKYYLDLKGSFSKQKVKEPCMRV